MTYDFMINAGSGLAMLLGIVVFVWMFIRLCNGQGVELCDPYYDDECCEDCCGEEPCDDQPST